LATTPPNQASSTGSTGKVKGKVKPKNRPAGTPSTPSARWNANKHHTVNYADHLANVQAKQQLGTTDLTAPPSGAQAIREANSAADLQFGPQVRAAQQGLANIDPWFQEHLARIAGYANAAKTAMQPVLDQAGQLANPATAAQTQAAPGLDPNSEAGRASAMAAQGRAALAALGQQALQTNAQSTQDTFAGQALTASREQPQARQYAQGQLANAQSDRGAAVTKFLTDARANAQNYQIARGTLNLNTDKAVQDASDKAASRTVSRKNTRDRIKAQGDAATQRANERGPDGQQLRVHERAVAAIQRPSIAGGSSRHPRAAGRTRQRRIRSTRTRSRRRPAASRTRCRTSSTPTAATREADGRHYQAEGPEDRAVPAAGSHGRGHPRDPRQEQEVHAATHPYRADA
jgi:hypothetical protein